jgi:serine protease Do
MNKKDKIRWNRATYGLWARLFAAFLLSILSLSPEPPAARAKEAVSPTPGSFSALVEKASPGVVNIRTTRVVRAPLAVPEPFQEFFERFFGDRLPREEREFRQRSLGSGFIIDKEGLIFTNNHVIEGTDEILVMLEDGREFPAEIVGRDPRTDLALIRIDTEMELHPLRFGDSDALNVGEWVVAIGNPFGLGNTVTAGIVSAKYRRIGVGAYDSFIQTDASINPGNSGGPLLNTGGEVIGINTAILGGRGGNIGIGFAIPVNMAKELLPQLKEGRVIRGWLGVMIQDITPPIQERLGLDTTRGALVSGVTSGSPADKAGIQRGDVIVSFDGEEIEEMSDLPHVVAMTEIGKTVPVEIIRRGEKKTIRVTVEEMVEETPRPEPAEAAPRLGLTLEQVTPRIARKHDLPEPTGLVVVDVEMGSPAARVGLVPGDVILEINQEEINTVREFRSHLEGLQPGDPVLLLISREGSTIYVAVQLQ